jgi:hypothetical protein
VGNEVGEGCERCVGKRGLECSDLGSRERETEGDGREEKRGRWGEVERGGRVLWMGDRRGELVLEMRVCLVGNRKGREGTCYPCLKIITSNKQLVCCKQSVGQITTLIRSAFTSFTLPY